MIRLAVRAAAVDAEPVNAALLELAPAGVERIDGDDYVEFALYGAPGELPSLPRGEAEIAGTLVRVTGEELPDDWSERWKRFHRPILLAGRLYLRPPWEEPARRPGVEDIVIDPGQAFGTGAHPTTRLCLELLLELAPGGSFADLGCGSGVLAIAAAKLGYGPVAAFDSEAAALAAAEQNAGANGVELARLERINLRAEPAPFATTVAANLMRPLLLRVATLCERPPPTLILSGLLEHEADEVAGAFVLHEERARVSDGDWSALLMTVVEGRGARHAAEGGERPADDGCRGPRRQPRS
ncbi:MAG: 50S ribosomal protein L11 methyltransferase [Thermoleophilaceae bacterium]